MFKKSILGDDIKHLNTLSDPTLNKNLLFYFEWLSVSKGYYTLRHVLSPSVVSPYTGVLWESTDRVDFVFLTSGFVSGPTICLPKSVTEFIFVITFFICFP